MKCVVCGSLLPEGARVCSRCGTPIAINSRDSGGSSTSPTIAASEYQPEQQPASAYGLDPYNAPPPMYNPSHASYSAPTEQAPPPPPILPLPGQMPLPPQPPRNQGKRTVIIVGVVVLLLLLLGEGGYLLYANRAPVGPTTQQLNATATARSFATSNTRSTQNPYTPYSGTLVLSDAMRDNSKGYKWDEATWDDNNGGKGKSVCGFSNGGYHITRSSKGALVCVPEAKLLVFNNAAFEVNLTIVQGYETGVFVRLDQSQLSGYLFAVNVEGSYVLEAANFNAPNPKDQDKIFRSGANAAIKKGLRQTNLVALVANGDTLSVYVNNQFVDSFPDKAYINGQIGIYAYGDSACDVIASDARVWKLPL